MNYQRQWLVGLMSSYAVDQRDIVDLLSREKDIAAHAEAATMTSNELDEVLSAPDWTPKTPDELEDFLSAWEALSDEALLIY